MTTHVMVDLETLGKGPEAVILSIGAIKFDPFKDDVEDEFYQAIDPVSAQAMGFQIDASTVVWWMDKGQDAARAAFMAERHTDLASAIDGFARWFGTNSLPVWGNGATFDNVILRNACDKILGEAPWSYRDDRCYRTIKKLAPSLPVFSEIKHHALWDARHQVKYLQALVKHLGLEVL